MGIRSRLSSKILFGSFIIIYTVFLTILMIIIEPNNVANIPEMIGMFFVEALLIGGVPFIIYHFIIGDRKKKIEKN